LHADRRLAAALLAEDDGGGGPVELADDLLKVGVRRVDGGGRWRGRRTMRVLARRCTPPRRRQAMEHRIVPGFFAPKGVLGDGPVLEEAGEIHGSWLWALGSRPWGAGSGTRVCMAGQSVKIVPAGPRL